MIAEDYVSFDVAKLLKERGFNERVMSYYTESGLEGYMLALKATKNTELGNEFISRPTLQMAMKWLRNIHDIVCSVGLFTDLPEMPPYWSFNILNQSTANVMYEAFDVKCETYEEACEAAIKYCLENLI